MTDLAARIRHAASCLELSTGEENRLHTFRLLSNDVLNRRAQPTRDNLLRDAKTLAFLVRRLTGSDLPADLRTLLAPGPMPPTSPHHPPPDTCAVCASPT